MARYVVRVWQTSSGLYSVVCETDNLKEAEHSMWSEESCMTLWGCDFVWDAVCIMDGTKQIKVFRMTPSQKRRNVNHWK